MAIDTQLAVVYTSGDKKLIFGLSLERKTQYSRLKLSNCEPGTITIDSDARRLYCASREGLLLILNIDQKEHLVLVHTLKLIKNPGLMAPIYGKQLYVDTRRNLLVCRMSKG